MIPPVERAVQKMMNSPSKPVKPPFWTSTFSILNIHSYQGGMQDIKTPIQTIVMQLLSHSLFRYRGVTRDGNPHPY